MTFVYPAVFTPHEKDNGFHVEFPDLECCEADGPDLEECCRKCKRRSTQLDHCRIRRYLRDPAFYACG